MGGGTIPVLTFNYVNHRGEHSTRQVIPQQVRFGTGGYYTEPEWLLDAFDLSKNAMRTFSMRKMNIKPGEIVPGTHLTPEELNEQRLPQGYISPTQR